MRDLLARWPVVAKKLASARRKLLILDFDGTLAPIVRNPSLAAVDRPLKRVLARLVGRDDFVVAVVSGRALADVRTRVGLPGAVFVGNHGLEVSGRGARLSMPAKRVRRRAASLRTIARKLKAAFYLWPGVQVEDKVYTLSVHFRNIHPYGKPAFDELMKFYRQKFKKYPVVWRKGKKVWEARPFPSWGKGDAALALAARFAGALPVVLGDDDTDEDMFRALAGRGLTVRVGRSSHSSADYYLKSQKKVILLLKKLSS